MIETHLASQFIASALAGDATLSAIPVAGPFAGVADQGVAAPVWIVFTVTASPDAAYANAIRVFSKPLVKIECVGRYDDYAKVEAAADRADELLKLVRNSSVGAAWLSCYRDPTYGAFELYEVDNGVRYVRMGAFYRFLIKS